MIEDLTIRPTLAPTAALIPQPEHDGLSGKPLFGAVFTAAQQAAVKAELVMMGPNETVVTKGGNPNQIAKEADVQSDTEACDVLVKEIPDEEGEVTLVSEETHPDGTPPHLSTAETDSNHSQSASGSMTIDTLPNRKLVGYIDGLDCSAEAAAGEHGEYGVMVALIEYTRAGIRYLAVTVIFPNTCKAFYADGETGQAWLQLGSDPAPKQLLGHPEADLKDGVVIFNIQYKPALRDPRVFKTLAALEVLHEMGVAPKPQVTLPSSVVGLRVFAQDDEVIAVVHGSTPGTGKRGPWDKAAIEGVGQQVRSVVYRHIDGRPLELFEETPEILAANPTLFDAIQALSAIDNEALMARAHALMAMEWDELHERFGAEA